MTRVLFTPAAFPDAPAPGQYVSTGYATAIACPECGVVWTLLRVDLIASCPCCPWVGWVRLAVSTERPLSETAPARIGE